MTASLSSSSQPPSASIVEASPPTAIKDTRIIDFSPDAIRAAAESVGVRILRLPVGVRVKSVRFRPESNSLYLDYGVPGLERTVSEGEIAALLIAYCIDSKIPMPMKAKKQLRVTATSIAFGFVTIRRLAH